MTRGIPLEDRHPAVQSVARYLRWEEESDPQVKHAMAMVRAHCQDLAGLMLENLDDGTELTAGLRKLLEAKDCFVRAALAQPVAAAE